MPNSCGNATTTTVFAPILPGREEALQSVLLQIPSGDTSPFECLGNTHFTRFVIVDRLEYEAAPQIPDGLKSHYLLFNAVFDGPLDDFIASMLRHFPELVDRIWSHCVGYPGSANPAAVRTYLRHNELEATFFFAAYGNSTLPQVRKALALRGRLTQFAIGAQGASAEELQARFRREFAESAEGTR